MNCRHCSEPLTLQMADLATCPPSNSYLSAEALLAPEKWYPLKVFVCQKCWLAQTADFVDREECFSSNYAYFSSCSTTWVAHARHYAQKMISGRGLTEKSLVMEVASNDGYLLQHFAAAGIPCYGVEPTESTALVARTLGLDVVGEFFGVTLAQRLLSERGPVDLLAANNVLAHVPDINNFVAGVRAILKPSGLATFEFPHLMQLLKNNYFDTIYHEHFSYLSLFAVQHILASAGLRVIDIEELETHGGSLRVHASPSEQAPSPRVEAFLNRERRAGLLEKEVYQNFQKRIEAVKDAFLEFLLQEKRSGRKVAAYGAAAKGNTLINFAGVKTDLISFVVDRSPGKLGQFLPGSRIPIVDENFLRSEQPDTIVILPWNLRDEISMQLAYAREWDANFAVALPQLEVF
jgi:2-polyprenyl-3-methyl-5-hydroxy-6-metoxy-1,4-benzoquinol methylase